MTIYLLSAATTFTAGFLKGFQWKNMQGNHKRSIAALAFCQAFLEVASVLLVIRGNWTIGLSAGTGAVLGTLSALEIHERFYGRQEEMSGGNRNHVCVPCRKSRRGGEFDTLVCHGCGQPMTHIGTRWRVPKKTDDGSWDEVSGIVERVKKGGLRP